MKVLNIILKVLLCLLFVTPILGGFGVLPEAQPEFYTTTKAYDFIMTITEEKYIPLTISFVFLAAFVLVVTNRTALAALLITPVTLNVIFFHSFLDGGLFAPGALMANMLLLLNVYFLWQNRSVYAVLLQKNAGAR